MIWIRLTHPLAPIFIGALYHPPSTKLYTDLELLDYIEHCVDELVSSHARSLVILAGDMNQLSESELVGRTGFDSIVNQPTRGTAILDRILVSEPCYERVRVLAPMVPSDHKVIVATGHSNNSGRPINKIRRSCKHRKVNPKSNAEFLGFLSTFEFDDQDIEAKSSQEQFDDFYETALGLLNKFYPEKTVTMTNKDPDYITPAIKSKLKLKNHLLRKGRVEKADALSKRIGLEIAKNNSTMAKSLGSNTTTRELWSAVRKLRNRSNNEVRDAVGVDAEALNRHYARTSYDSNYIEPTQAHCQLE